MKRFSWLLLLALALPLAAQLPRPENVVQLRAEPAPLKGKAGSGLAVTLIATIEPGFHINSNKPTEEYLIPSKVELAEGSGFTLERVDYPAGVVKSFAFAPDDKLSVYEGTVKLPVRLKAKPGVQGGQTAKLIFHYQACNDQVCLRPARREIDLSVKLD
jgi:DsbC/DsbD-like thiol-disulfide interchange protein